MKNVSNKLASNSTKLNNFSFVQNILYQIMLKTETKFSEAHLLIDILPFYRAEGGNSTT